MLRGIWLEGKDDLSPVYELRGRVLRQDRTDMDVWSRHLIIREQTADSMGPVMAVGSMTEELHHVFRLYAVCVDEAFRGQGVGDFLVKILVNEAWEKGGLEMVLDADKKSRGFFMKQGFLETARNGENIAMRRVL